MHTIIADKTKRMRIPDAKPGQVFSYLANGDGTILLTPVKADAKEAFPRGSLLKYMTPQRDADEQAICKACVQGPSGEE